MESTIPGLENIPKETLEHLLGKISVDKNIFNSGLDDKEPLKNINQDIISYTESYLALFNKYVEFQLKDLERDMENIKNVIECQLDLPV
jgi:hypothetical protein